MWDLDFKAHADFRPSICSVFLVPIVFARAVQNPHTPGGNAAVKRCKEAYDSFSPSHTDAALPLGSGAYSTDLLKRQAQYFKSLSPWQAQYFGS